MRTLPDEIIEADKKLSEEIVASDTENETGEGKETVTPDAAKVPGEGETAQTGDKTPGE
jgi:hypothetical protein